MYVFAVEILRITNSKCPGLVKHINIMVCIVLSNVGRVRKKKINIIFKRPHSLTCEIKPLLMLV